MDTADVPNDPERQSWILIPRPVEIIVEPVVHVVPKRFERVESRRSGRIAGVSEVICQGVVRCGLKGIHRRIPGSRTYSHVGNRHRLEDSGSVVDGRDENIEEVGVEKLWDVRDGDNLGGRCGRRGRDHWRMGWDDKAQGL